LVSDDDSYEKPSKNEALGGEVGAGEGTSVQSFRISHRKKESPGIHKLHSSLFIA
jgi:hypothetical protein